MDIPDAAERILDAAAELFTERGYGGTTTRAVASRADVNEVTIFRRFTSKAGLLEAVADRIATDSAALTLEAAVRTAAPPSDVGAVLESLARSEVAAAVRHGGLAVRMAVDARSIPEVAARFEAGTGGNLAALTAYLAARQRDGAVRQDVPPELLAEAFFALTSSFVLGRHLRGAPVPAPGPELDLMIRHLVALFRDGALRATSPTHPSGNAPDPTCEQ